MLTYAEMNGDLYQVNKQDLTWINNKVQFKANNLDELLDTDDGGMAVTDLQGRRLKTRKFGKGEKLDLQFSNQISDNSFRTDNS
jgi:myo-inositol-hexaphosphate 3-phosphohydrolase